MKGILAAIAFVPVAAHAQFDASAVERGAFELSGDAALDFSTGSTRMKFNAPGAVEEKVDSSMYQVDLTGLYYVAPNVGLGLSVFYDKSTDEFRGVEESTATFVFGPAITAQLPLAPQVALFGRGAVGYATSTHTATGDPDVEASGYGIVLQGGIKYFVVKQFSLNVALAYNYAKLTTDAVVTATGTTPEMDAKNSTVGVSAGLSVYFGR